MLFVKEKKKAYFSKARSLKKGKLLYYNKFFVIHKKNPFTICKKEN